MLFMLKSHPKRYKKLGSTEGFFPLSAGQLIFWILLDKRTHINRIYIAPYIVTSINTSILSISHNNSTIRGIIISA